MKKSVVLVLYKEKEEEEEGSIARILHESHHFGLLALSL